MSQKGSKFERDVCKKLSLWWTNGSNDAIFWRTSQSGGRATTRAKLGKETKNSHADVWATDPIGQPFLDVVTIEVKRGYSQFTIADLLDKSSRAAFQQYEKWFIKLIETSRRAKTPYWALITKRDQREALVFFPSELTMVSAMGIHGIDRPVFKLDVVVEYIQKITCCHLDKFLASVSPEDFIRYNNDQR